MFKKNPIDRDDYFMGLAFTVAAGSSFKQQGAVIVSLENEVLGTGFDGTPTAISESNHFVHAEINAIFNSKEINYGVIYLTHTPCYNCIMSLLAAKIKKIIYFPTKDLDANSSEILKLSHIQAIAFDGNLNWMRDYLTFLKSQYIFD